MARRLDVYLHDRLAGHLDQDDAGRLGFVYAGSWLDAPDRKPLSQSLPFKPEPFDDRASRPFFAGLLPEAEKREIIARALHVSARNDFALLDKIGGECAGAITFLPPGAAPPSATSKLDYRRLDKAEVARILDILPERPLLAGDADVRLSLAGAQDKLPVRVVNGAIELPLHGSPSSHILKPPIRRFDDTVHNEGFCMALARKAGLHVAETSIQRAAGRDYLLVTRYDRVHEASGKLQRLHQEDFCQALGIPPTLKYQNEGGPGFDRCFKLVRSASARPAIDIERLLDAVIFNFLIGNHDAHGKNFSLLYRGEITELAPLYDLSSTVVYPELSSRMAMKIGGTYEPSELIPRYWDRFAKEVALGAPQFRRRLLATANRLPDQAVALCGEVKKSGDHRPAIDRIVDVVADRAKLTLQRFEVA